MKNNAPTFAFIGKPNNGKSSMISALTFDDRIKVSKEVGTTTKAKPYSYTHNDRVIANFYDTPGFEKAKALWSYIRKNRDENSYGNNLLREFISKNSNEKSMQKDIEILSAILESDFIVFVINISENYNQNVIGYELEIIHFIKKPILILFNKIQDKDYTEQWREKLQEYDLTTIQEFNPMNSSYENIHEIFKNLYRVDATLQEKQHLDDILQTHIIHLRENTESSAKKIAEMMVEILQFEDTTIFKGDRVSNKDKAVALLKYQEKIYLLEKKAKRAIEKIWGYHQVKVIDNREEIDSEENVKLGLSKERLIVLGSVVGVGAGAVLGAPVALVDFGLTALISSGIGGIIGGSSAYFISNKFHSMIVSKNEIIHKIDKVNYNVSFILLKRSLEHLSRLIKHGHANRNNIVISQNSDELIFNKEWNFTTEEEKEIANIHTSIVKDEYTQDKQQELAKVIANVMDREIIL